MTAAGLTLESPRIGQRIRFLETAAETGGERLVIEASMQPGASIPPHVHLSQTEDFEILKGEGRFRLARCSHVARLGEVVHVPAGVPHRFRNALGSEVHLRATLRPALRTEELFERLFRLGTQGRVNRLGAPSPWATARLIHEFRDEFFYLAGVPVSIQRLLAGTRP